MIEMLKDNGCNKLILFIHGLTGSSSTWKNDEASHFADFLNDIPSINANYDIAEYTYYTKFISPPSLWGCTLRYLGIKGKSPVKGNLDIEDISDILSANIYEAYDEYDEIIIIAHSMGGLVTKSYINKSCDEERYHKCSLFISLAVPHHGSKWATYISELGHNQGVDIDPLSDFLDHTNDKWEEIDTNLLPEVACIWGAHDKVVLEKSALPKKLKNCVKKFKVDEDHESITAVRKTDPAVLNIVSKLISEQLNNSNHQNANLFSFLDNQNEYDNEDFVLKMILADLHEITQHHAKELFFNADHIIHKYRNDEKKVRELKSLYFKIKSIYADEFLKFNAGLIKNEEALLSSIYEKIKQKDQKGLLTKELKIEDLHKQGILHHLANTEGYKIWWSTEHTREQLEELRRSRT
ncbi:MAG: alpha/beta hydrolase [Desulfovibrionales bacterium]|nr:alpha/beta hydrolase [Desulfovibrionales bacterium]